MADNFFADGSNPYEVVRAELVAPPRRAKPPMWWRVLRSTIVAVVLFLIGLTLAEYLIWTGYRMSRPNDQPATRTR